MPCFRPLNAYRSSIVNPSGKRGIVFKPTQGFYDIPLTLPCGQCIGCRLERSRQWALRCVHEASLYDHNSFITLTYDSANLPSDGSLIKKDFQDFMKRLRKAVYEDSEKNSYDPFENPRFLSSQPTGVRYFHCGEYGEQLGRPHYHACLFNLDFADKALWKETPGGKLYVSETLSNIWDKGICSLGSVTFDSAAYVARYITKKITGDSAESHYCGKQPEYTTMSRRPGIGKGWFDKWGSDTYSHDSVIMRSREMKPPKYYDKQFELASPSDFAKIKRTRKAGATAAGDDIENSPARLRVRERVQELTLEQKLKRSYEK